MTNDSGRFDDCGRNDHTLLIGEGNIMGVEHDDMDWI